MIVLEHERERPKEQVEYAKQYCGEYAEVEALQQGGSVHALFWFENDFVTHHWFENEELEWPDARPEYRLCNRPVHLLDWGYPFRIAGFCTQSDRFPAQKHRVIRFRHEQDDQAKLEASVSLAMRVVISSSYLYSRPDDDWVVA
jgi:hypothetical protein